MKERVLFRMSINFVERVNTLVGHWAFGTVRQQKSTNLIGLVLFIGFNNIVLFFWRSSGSCCNT